MALAGLQLQPCVASLTPLGGIEPLTFLYIDSIALNTAATITLDPFKAAKPAL